MLKINISVCHFGECLFIVDHLRHFLQHFLDTVCGSLGDHDHDEHKGHHHQGHEDLQCVHDDTRKLTGQHRSINDALAADQYHKQHDRVNGKLHDRGVPRHDLLRLCKELKYDCGDLSKLLNLMFAPDIRLYHAGSVDIFLDGIIEYVVLVKHLDKMRVRLLRDIDQHTAEDRHHGKQQKRDRHIDRQRHDP